MWTKEEYEEKLRELKELEEMQKYTNGLPHLFGWKFYPWARKVWDSTNPEIFLCSANQVGKSTIAVRKNIRLATDPSLWPKFWPELEPGRIPNLFWYLMPTMPVIQTEFETKWEPLFLPRGEFKTHPQFGWSPEYDKGYIQKIHFNTGVQIQFKSYSMKIKDLQGATVYHTTADEEMPVEFLPEIKARSNASSGKFMMVCTPTQGQLYWKQTFEPSTKAEEKHPEALKIQVSLYDSQFFDDGTPSHWTNKKIESAKANCPTDAEIQRRIFGKFQRAAGLRLESFDHVRNMSDAHPIPKSWVYYGGVDIGSGGQSGHPCAMVILACSPDFKQGRIIRAWRGDGVPTAASDVLDRYRALRGNLSMMSQVYDWASKDFFTYASRLGESFVPAEKAKDAGFGLFNTLLKNGMLKFQRGDPEIEKLVQEVCSLPVEYDPRKTANDLVDATRYTIMAVPWNFEDIESSTKVADALSNERIAPKEKTELELRREFTLGLDRSADNGDDIQQEFDIWNDLSGTSEE